MGKRKERRLAAMMAAGRRVKLDLCAEPSGEMVGKNEVGGDLDQDHQTEVPTSPSSSGQKQENPLLLLGQYSDDELDEEAGEQPKHAVKLNASVDQDDQGSVDPGGDEGNGTDKATVTADVKQGSELLDSVEKLDHDSPKESDIAVVTTDYNESQPEIGTVPDASEMQILGDLTGEWKVVMHEQSKQCYYWNTVTGETSWEIPNGLALVTGAASEENVSSGIETTDYPIDMHSYTLSNNQIVAYANVSTADGHEGSDPVTKNLEAYGSAVDGEVNGEVAQTTYDANQSSTHYSTAFVGEDHMSSDKDKMLTRLSECYQMMDVHSSQLVQYGESLLQRLKALQGSQKHLEGYEGILKEIEIRVSDCKALSSYGSSLLPFWWHTDTQLKQLESGISKVETSFAQSENDSKMGNEQPISRREEHSLSHYAGGSEVVEKNNMPDTAEDNISFPDTDASKVQGEATSQIPESEDIETKGLSSGLTSQEFQNGKEAEVVREAGSNPHFMPKVESHAEDVDMDVEMEVDEENLAGQITYGELPSSECPASPEKIIRPNLPSSEDPPMPSDEPNFPPPPDEEWIPPPPPDNEPIPPPPPEEPPAPYPPPYSDAVPAPCQDQYNLGYTLPAYEYYSPVVGEVTNVNYYTQAEGTHIAEPQPSTYYEPVVANAFPEVAADVNPVAPAAYYDLSGAAIPHGSVLSSTGSSGFYAETASNSYLETVSASAHIKSAEFAVSSGINSLPQARPEPDTSAVARESNAGTMLAVSTVPTAQGTGTASVNGSAMAAPGLVASKSQHKVVRAKKRTVAVAPTLRSNKKVSSLVDKWKAAKEELHGDEDEEPENAYELLERKRRKEIEVWRARQIASGEAQDNANFLPLGGDWRERVKRRRAEAKAETVETSGEVVENEKQQPNLTELSKDLPAGWQAYWDESTKEVYYGNSITSETTWTRPTR